MGVMIPVGGTRASGLPHTHPPPPTTRPGTERTAQPHPTSSACTGEELDSLWWEARNPQELVFCAHRVNEGGKLVGTTEADEKGSEKV